MGTKKSSQWYNDCIEFSDTRPKIVLKDKGGKSEFKVDNINRKRVIAVRVDGCLIVDGEKCDYLLMVCNDLKCEDRNAYLVELKGSDLIHAIEQIDKTLTFLKNELADFQRIFARISLTRCNVTDITTQKYIKLKKRMIELKGDLKQAVKLIDKI